MSLVDYKEQATIHAAFIQARLQIHTRPFTYADIVAFVLEHKEDYPAIYFRTTKGPVLAVDEEMQCVFHPLEPGSCAYCGEKRYYSHLVNKRQLPNPTNNMIQENVRVCLSCQREYDENEGEMLFQHIKLYILFSVLSSISAPDEHGKNQLEEIIQTRLFKFDSADALYLLRKSLELQCSISLLFFLHPEIIRASQHEPIIALAVTSCLMTIDDMQSDEKTQDDSIHTFTNQLHYVETIGAEQYTLQQLMAVDAVTFAEIIQTLWQQNPHADFRIRKKLHILLCLRAYQQCTALCEKLEEVSKHVLAMQHELRLCLTSNKLTPHVQTCFSALANEYYHEKKKSSYLCCQWLLAHPDCQPNDWQDAAGEPWLWLSVNLTCVNQSCIENPENLAVFTAVLARPDCDPNYCTNLQTFLLIKLLTLKEDIGFKYFQQFINKEGVKVNISAGEYGVLTLLLGPYMDFDSRGAYDFTLKKLTLLLDKGADINAFHSIIESAADFLSFLHLIVDAMQFASDHVKQDVTLDMITNDYPQLSQLTVQQQKKLIQPATLAMFASENIDGWRDIIYRCELGV